MKVVFLEDVDGVAKGGEIKDVKKGFARNYLIPKKLAAPATHNHIQRISKLTKQSDEDRVKKFKLLSNLSESLDKMEVKIEMRAASNRRLYGSVTATIIADAINDQLENPIARQLVQLDEPIREIGTYPIAVRLHEDLIVEINVIVNATGDELLDLDEPESDTEVDSDTENIDTTNINEDVSSGDDVSDAIISETSDEITEAEETK